ncbi:hypothetical protein ACOMHN_041717 [Nucella lapillus]
MAPHGASGVPNTKSLVFARDGSADGRLRPKDPDALEFVVPHVLSCSTLCASYDWCISLFFTKKTGWCSLHATVFRKASLVAKSEGTVYYRNVVDWCPSKELAMYNRLADMCVYFELDKSHMSRLLTGANSLCSKFHKSRLAQNLSLLEMQALLNLTSKNSDLREREIYVGLMVDQFDSKAVIWLDNTPVDQAIQNAYLAQVGGSRSSSSTCGFIRAKDSKPLNFGTCKTLHPYVCELARPGTSLASGDKPGSQFQTSGADLGFY